MCAPQARQMYATAPKRTVKNFISSPKNRSNLNLSSERSRFSNKNAKASTSSRFIVRSFVRFHFVAMATWNATVSGFPESNFSVSEHITLFIRASVFFSCSTRNETTFVLFRYKMKRTKSKRKKTSTTTIVRLSFIASLKKTKSNTQTWNECPLRASDSLTALTLNGLMLYIISYSVQCFTFFLFFTSAAECKIEIFASVDFSNII